MLVIKKTSFIYLAIISSFGPYIVPSLGLRFDQLIIYGLFIFLLLSNNLKLPRSSLSLAIFFLLFALFLSPFFNAINSQYILSQTLLVAQIENYFQPIATFLVFFSLMPSHKDDLDKIMKYGLELILWLLALNTLLSIYIFLNPETALVNIFTGTKIIGDWEAFGSLTNAELNLTTGKFAGIFSQTFIVGFAYSLGLLVWGFLYKNNEYLDYKKILVLIFILIGGVMSFSKVFLVIGLPLFLLFMGLKMTLILIFTFSSFVLFLTLYNPALFEFISDYEAMKYVYRLLNGFSGDFFNIYTSGRFSSDSLIVSGIIEALIAHPFFGYGYGSIETSDFSIYEVIVLGGYVGLLSYLLIMLTLTIPIFTLHSLRDKYFYSFFMCLLVISSIAAPILTANRISILIWFIISITFAKISKPLNS